ncbi:hypothetical protein L602_000800000410 [Cupriavidus gilardii J11]|uniref:Uncharacterized protein n=1 Tax=Cupriavidus gilardii J11 TaxID=936133 RepID=A0A562B158_9BURK|nr:hypothetical protein L602_000800000410 [Cupriavidus gilardii J11]
MSDGKLGIAGTTVIAFAVAGLALATSLWLAYLAAPPKGRALIRDALDHDSDGGSPPA